MHKKRIENFRNIIRRAISSIAIAGLIFIATNAQLMAAGSPASGAIVPVLSLLLDEEPALSIANAGADFQVLVGELAQLDGSGSIEPTNLPLTFLWSFVSVPTGSTATLSVETLVNPTFVVDLPGSYIIRLVVSNGIEDSLPATVTVSNTNRTPLADAGTDTIVSLNQAVQLDGSNSSDIDGDPLSYLWSFDERPAASAAALLDDTAEMPQFTPDIKGNYILNLVVNDGFIDSDADQVEVLAGLELDLQVADTFFGVGRGTAATLTLDPPAPAQGVVVSLSVDDANIIGLSTAEVTYTEGQTEKIFTLTGLASGTTTLRASGTNIDEVAVGIEVSAALISIDAIAPISPSAATSAAISITEMAPVGGVTINLETLDSAVATVSPATLFIAEGQFVPAQNAQVTGVGLGNTVLRATGLGYAPDERAIEVDLAAAFNPTSLNVPETLTRDIVLTLDAPAPTGGVSFALTVVGDPKFSVQNIVAIAAGETQSQPITLAGLEEGQAILRASAAGFVDADATITVIDAPNVFLSNASSSVHLPEAIIGLELQNVYRVRLEVIPTTALDIKVSVPLSSGVLLSPNSTTVGSDTLIIEDVVSSNTNFFAIQGVSLDDDVPVTIEVVEANSTTPAGYEALPSTIDIDPSGVFVTTTDFTTKTFTTNRTVAVQTGLLFDNEDGALDGTLRQAQRVRGGSNLLVPMQVDDAALLTLPNGATATLSIGSNEIGNSIALAPIANGVATVSIVNQPTGFSLPSDKVDSVEVTIVAPKAFVRSTGSASHLSEAIVGLDLQRHLYVGLEVAPPSPVDIMVSVSPSSGVLLSTQATVAGSNQILFEDVTTTRSPLYFMQGTALDDDVPITVTVSNANTTDAAGYEILASTADVDPSGIYVSTGDYNTTTFSTNRSVTVVSTLLFDIETPGRVGESSLSSQAVRGGLDLIVPMQVDAAAVASLPTGATENLTIPAGASQSGISVDPISAGQAIISIVSLPGAFVIPSNRDDNAVVTVTAANAFLRSSTSASHQAEAIVGIDLQTAQRIGLAVTPPAAVDITVSVPAASGVLLSTDATLSGTTSLLFEDVAITSSPLFYAQGTALGDDVAVTINVFEANTTTPIGYNVLASSIDVDPSGVYMASGAISTNTFAPNRNITVSAAVLYDDEDLFSRDGQSRSGQPVRGGIDLSVPMAIDHNTVAALPDDSTGTLTISSGQTNGTIELDPLTAGQATVSITAQPNVNFTLPSNRGDEVVVTITAPNAVFGVTTAFVGDELQIPVTVFLAENPPNPVDVTVEVISSAVALVAKDSSMAGSASVTFSNVSSASVGTIYVQGLTLNGATQIKVSAPGYNDDTADVEVVLSGFRLSGNFSNVAVGGTRDLSILGARLNANGTFSGGQQVRGGASFDIVVTSSVPGVGTVTSPVTLSNGDSSNTTTFTAVAAGTSNIQITQPAGFTFTPPVGITDEDITVD